MVDGHDGRATVGAPAIRVAASSQARSWLPMSRASADGRLGCALLSKYCPVMPAACSAAARKTEDLAAASAEALRCTHRTNGHTNRQAGTACGVSACVPGVHAMPGLVALATTPAPSSRRASANVHSRLSSLACAYTSMPT